MGRANYMTFPGNTSLDYAVLHLLLESQGRTLSWAGIAGGAGITVEHAKGIVGSLIDHGFNMITAGEAGCAISEGHDVLSVPGIYRQLNTRALGRQIQYAFTTASTNDDAKVMAPSCPDGTLVICETQTKGKGRLGRQWESPRGGVFMSVILKPEITPAEVPPLALAAGYAVAKALEGQGLNPSVKWPNDVLVDGKKLAGILCELGAGQGQVEHVIVGVGINANISADHMPQEVRKRSTSISDSFGKPVDRNSSSPGYSTVRAPISPVPGVGDRTSHPPDPAFPGLCRGAGDDT